MKLFVPPGLTRVRWHLPPTIAGLDLSGFTVTPFAPALLNSALGLPGKTVVPGPDQIWAGFSGPGNESFAVPPFSNSGNFEHRWIETTFTGPAELTWTQYGGQDIFSPAELDGEEFLSAFLSPYPDGTQPPDPFRRMEFGLFIPAGSHTVRLKMVHHLFGERAGIGNVRLTPVPAAYAAWQPPVPNSPDVHFTPVPSADYDEDGLSNLAEFTWRTDPFTHNQPLRPLAFLAGGRITLTLPAPRPLTDGVRAYVESSTGDLAHWQRAAVETLSSPPAGQVQYRYTVPPATPRVFLRVGVEIAP
jgi:hypothetical protein